MSCLAYCGESETGLEILKQVRFDELISVVYT